MTRLHAANRYDRLTHDLGRSRGGPQQVSVNLLLLTLSHSSLGTQLPRFVTTTAASSGDRLRVLNEGSRSSIYVSKYSVLLPCNAEKGPFVPATARRGDCIRNVRQASWPPIEKAMATKIQSLGQPPSRATIKAAVDSSGAPTRSPTVIEGKQRSARPAPSSITADAVGRAFMDEKLSA
jgi:hypothetical protein